MPTISTDICIVGAGPAGATTSLFLSKFQIPHLILDAHTFPRDKVCGDGLDLKVMRVLNSLEKDLVKSEILNNPNFIATKGVVVNISPTKKALMTHTPKNEEEDLPYFCFSKRQYFDNFLVEKINPTYATFLQATKVEKLLGEGNNRTVIANNGNETFEIKTKLVIGADGDHSVVLRSLGKRPIEREHYSGGLRQYWKGISGLQPNNYLELYLPKSLPFAYLWIFPLPNGEANVGCGLLSSLIAKNKVDLKNLLQEIISTDPVIKDRFKNATPLEKTVGWGLPLASLRRNASGDGWLLVGDAASLICPTTGEGIGPGMMSGMIAAHFIKRAVETNNFSHETFKNYNREIYKRLEQSIQANSLLKKTSPAFYNFFINNFGPTKLCRYYFSRSVKKWINTAYKSELKVTID
jgi:geranylgeranyl reductase family protein